MNKFSQYPRSVQIAIIVGIGLIIFGIARLMDVVLGFQGFEYLFKFINAFFSYAWPIALIGAGIYLIWAGKNGRLKGFQRVNWNQPFGRSYNDKRIAGVCGGIAQFFAVDSTIIRVLVIILFVVAPWFTLIAYLIAAVALRPVS